MTWWFISGIWWVFVLINIGIAELNDSVRRKRIAKKITKQINHPLWAAIYCVLCAIPIYISRNWQEAISLLLLHISVFPVAFNLFSGESTFNLSKTTTAWTDKMMVKMGFKSTEEVNILSLCISILLLFWQIFNK